MIVRRLLSVAIMTLGMTLSAVAADSRVERIEPLSWWVGMNMPLQVMFYGRDIGNCSVAMAEGCHSVGIRAVHKADSPNYLFVDVDIAEGAEAGTYWFVLTDNVTGESFRIPYELDGRREGSRERRSFTTADMIYLLMPDRFANGDPSIDETADTQEEVARHHLSGRHGGDIQGIIDHLDYIAGTGATAIWSTPLLLDDEPFYSYHGYACGDYYKIDPRFGTNELYCEFVKKAHEHGLKVIMDIVTNHCGLAHWWIKDLPFGDWVHQFDKFTRTNNVFSANMDFNASRYDLRMNEDGWFDVSMPDMNLDNPFLLQYFKQWAVWWIEYADLDGLRVDTYPYNEKQPMSEWCAAVRAEYPNLNIVGECWTTSVPQLAYWQGDNLNKDGFNSHLPSIMDFPLQEAIGQAIPTDSVKWGTGMVKIYDVVSHDFVYHDMSKMMIFANNHDTDRLADIVRRNPDRVKIVMTLLATMRGIPQIFAGDEQMFVSADPTQGHGGLRVDFPGGWADDKFNAFEPKNLSGDAAEVYRHTTRLFNWRKTKPVIHNGRTLHFHSRDNTYAYFRYDDTDAVFVFVNNSRGAKRIPWENYAEIADSLCGEGVNVLTGETVSIDPTTKVGARQSLVVEYKRK